MNHLTKTQKRILGKMSFRIWKSAKELGASMVTMDALFKAGMIRKAYCDGFTASPLTCIVFKLRTQTDGELLDPRGQNEK